MHKQILDELVDKLNHHTLGVAKTPELREILQLLFNEDEVRVALEMNSYPEQIDIIAEHTKISLYSLTILLERMSNKGLVFSAIHGGQRYYALNAFFPGMIEINLMKGGKTDKEKKISLVFDKYYAQGGGHQIFPTSTRYSRVIPVQEEIKSSYVVLPYENVAEIIREHNHFAIATCFCRHQAELLGQSCGKPKNVCLNFGPFGHYLVERGFGKQATADDMFRALDQAEEAGLVHVCDNIKERVNFICNCCGCCCVFLRGVTQLRIPGAVKPSRFRAKFNKSTCSICENCIDVCPVNALTVNDEGISLNVHICLGCGLCNRICPTNALTMVLRESHQDPPETLKALQSAIMEERGQL